METYKSKFKYLEDINKRAEFLPEGFKYSKSSIKFLPEERPFDELQSMNLSLIKLHEKTKVFAGVFTQNAFPGAPVIIARERLKEKEISGILINNRIANVCAPGGVESASNVLKALAEKTELNAENYFMASTGVIGWKIPEKEIIEGLDEVVDSLKDDSIVDVANGIMTTDLFPKLRSVKVGDGSILGIAKGAGMIEPNMATMLSFIVTDIDISKKNLQKELKKAVGVSLNRISVDSDQSTSDMVIVLSSCKKKNVSLDDFSGALTQVCKDLAVDIVRNGEGTCHVIKTEVINAKNEQEAVLLGKAVINSPLVKTAIFGNDPNVGRIVMSIGDYFATMDKGFISNKVNIELGDEVIFCSGACPLDAKKEEVLSKYLKDRMLDPEKDYPEHDKNVEIKINLNRGNSKAVVYGSDLSYEYVKENADYRT